MNSPDQIRPQGILSRWMHQVESHPDRTAVTDCASGKSWTFRDFHQDVLSQPSEFDPVSEWIAPAGSGVDFLKTVLRVLVSGKKLALTDHPERDCPGNALEIPKGALPENAFLLKRTSGTSGAPRWVVFSEDQILADVDQIVPAMGLRPDWPNYSILSLAHSYGFSNLALPLLAHGIPLILGVSPLPASVSRDLESQHQCVIPAVPAIWRSWLNADLLQSLSSKIKVAISAGAPLELELERAVFEKTGVKIHNFYGSSECGGIAFDRSDTPRSQPGFIGSTLPNVKVNPDPDSGRICVSGPTVGMTYWPEPDEDLAGGIFRTGDLGQVESGKVVLTGRASDRINIAGRKVAPELVESALNSMESVEQSLVFGIPSTDAERGDEMVAVIKLASGELESGWNWRQQRNQLTHLLRPWEMPRTIWLQENLKPNSRGKLSRHEWKERYLKHRFQSTPSSICDKG